MNPRVVDVRPLSNYQLELRFANQEWKLFDVKPYLSIGIFEELRDTALFERVRPFNGTVVWPNDLDFDPDTLYLDGQSIDCAG